MVFCIAAIRHAIEGSLYTSLSLFLSISPSQTRAFNGFFRGAWLHMHFYLPRCYIYRRGQRYSNKHATDGKSSGRKQDSGAARFAPSTPLVRQRIARRFWSRVRRPLAMGCVGLGRRPFEIWCAWETAPGADVCGKKAFGADKSGEDMPLAQI